MEINMDKYQAGYKSEPSGKFITRYAQSIAANTIAQGDKDKAEFELGYKKGRLSLGIASKHMKLIECGLNTYVEAHDSSLIWSRDGDTIVRVSENLDWVDEFLKGKENETN